MPAQRAEPCGCRKPAGRGCLGQSYLYLNSARDQCQAGLASESLLGIIFRMDCKGLANISFRHCLLTVAVVSVVGLVFVAESSRAWDDLTRLGIEVALVLTTVSTVDPELCKARGRLKAASAKTKVANFDLLKAGRFF